ncbi:oxidoreductase [Phaeosphaeria sp. MPI-PUGE-AT-0046c]|nr:oxidoreductase [Phaeosphaeria sp. MPI-PUGE-AT-0046c]
MAPHLKSTRARSIKTCIAFATLFATTSGSIDSEDPIHRLSGSSFGTPFNTTYDYLIVGGGTSGLVLANRLASSNLYSVAIIEAGSFYQISNGNISQIPRYVWSGANTDFSDVNPLVDWEFETEPEQGVGGAKMHYPRGKTLGGSSARNHMIYQRPTRGSMQKWAMEVGDEGFGWDNFGKYFDRGVRFNEVDATKRVGNSTPPMDPAGERARSGNVNLSYANYVLPFTSWGIKAAEALGLKQLAGYIDGELIGSGWLVQTTDPKTMVRDSSETAFLRPVLGLSNLVVHHSTMALKILFEANEAVGVACSTQGKKFTLTARREVILSAGAFQSPQLLMVSGIGPRAILEKFGIPVLVEASGVGQGLEDHPAIGITTKVRVQSSTVLNSPAKNAAATMSFLNNGTGPLTSTGIDVFAWEKIPARLLSNTTLSSLNSTPSDWPDIEYMNTDLYPGFPPDGDDYVSITAIIVNTFSRGSVSLRSASMFDHPVININFLSDPRDQDMAIATLRRIREIFAQPVLEPVVVADGEVIPGRSVQSDAELLQYIRMYARTISHASATCKMGKADDKMAVVDSEGRVFGTKRLRVVDASAMPFLPPGHPMSMVYALAEMVSERVLEGARGSAEQMGMQQGKTEL